jgi:XTP/dITP diphosphohydrolase
MKLLFASANKNKISEIKAMLPAGFDLKGLADAGIVEEIPEPGETLRENSLLKAKYVSDKINDPETGIFADDSGLEVDALNGAPGVHSAYYSGLPKNDSANIKKLLFDLRNSTNRKAKFVTVITFILKGKVTVFEGEIAGTIAFEPRGTNGFGYDPVFVPQGSRSTFAQLPAEEKNAMSHRHQAVKKLISFLNDHQP